MDSILNSKKNLYHDLKNTTTDTKGKEGPTMSAL